MKNTHDLTPHLAFVEFHPLVHRFKNSTEQGHRADLALSCLKLMDRFKTIHPIHDELCLALRAQNHPMADKYGETWASNIESAGQQELFMGDEYIGQAEKPAFFEKFVPQFQKLLIGCDFANLQNLLNKVSLLVHFMNQCSDLALFTENRHFEFLFYQIVAVLYGLLWFSLLAKQDGLVQQNEETSPSLTWAQISRKCESYNKSHDHFLDDLDDKHPEVIEKVHSEFTFCTLVRWYCAFAKFKEHRLTEFCEDFELLQKDMSVLETIKLQSEALICYGISSIAAKPFKELDFQLNEQVLELFTSNTLVEASLYEVMKNLSMAKFTKAKDFWEPQLLNRLDSWVSYALPGKTKGTFWEFLRSVIDLKTFLLILSVSECIPRAKMLDKMGYQNASEITRSSVSNILVMLMSVLGLGEAHIFFHQDEDAFYNLPLDDKTRVMNLQDKLEDLDHAANTEAAAEHMKTLMIQKYFA